MHSKVYIVGNRVSFPSTSPTFSRTFSIVVKFSLEFDRLLEPLSDSSSIDFELLDCQQQN